MLGVYKNLSNEEYHADTDSISRSAILSYLESPYKYWANYLNPSQPEKKSTKAMDFGKAFHTFILEPRLFGELYTMEPERILLKDVGREAYDAYKNLLKEMEIEEKILISSEDMTLLFNMRMALQNNVDAWQLIDEAIYEQSYFWKDKESGLIVKARPDILHQNMIIDLKTISNASPRYFQNAMVSGGYHIQGAMIRDGVRELEGRDIPNVINIAIEKEYPYCIGIYIIDEYALDQGREKYKQALLDIKHAREYNFYPDYNVQTVSLPKYAL